MTDEINAQEVEKIVEQLKTRFNKIVNQLKKYNAELRAEKESQAGALQQQMRDEMTFKIERLFRSGKDEITKADIIKCIKGCKL